MNNRHQIAEARRNRTMVGLRIMRLQEEGQVAHEVHVRTLRCPGTSYKSLLVQERDPDDGAFSSREIPFPGWEAPFFEGVRR